MTGRDPVSVSESKKVSTGLVTFGCRTRKLSNELGRGRAVQGLSPLGTDEGASD